VPELLAASWQTVLPKIRVGKWHFLKLEDLNPLGHNTQAHISRTQKLLRSLQSTGTSRQSPRRTLVSAGQGEGAYGLEVSEPLIGTHPCQENVSRVYYALSKVRRCLLITSVANLTFNMICGMKFLVTGVSMFNNFIPTSKEQEIYLHLR
jgi:hypothetical protein